MLRPHTPPAIFFPRKSLGSVHAVLILAETHATRLDGAVAACRVAVQVARPVKALRPASRNLTFEITAVSLEIFLACE